MFLQTQKDRFVTTEGPLLLTGAGLGNWLNLEHFLLGIPGTESEIRTAIAEVYGMEKAAAFWRTYYRAFVADADFAFLRALGFNTVRLPVNIRAFQDHADFEKTTGAAELDRILALCEKHGMYGIIDLHAAGAGQNPDWHSDNRSGEALFFTRPEARAEAAAWWGTVAERYRDNPWMGGYDLLNEPCYFDPTTDRMLLKFYDACIEEIRRVDTNHLIILEGNTYSRDFRMFQSNPDDNLAYTFHYYPFLQLPGQLHSEGLKSRIRESLYKDVTLAHLEKLGKPIWCGETGHPLHQEESIGALGVFLELLEEMHISWSLWPHKDARAMALSVLRAEASYLSLTRAASGNWCFWDVFSQDSILSIQDSDDKHAFYRALSDHSTAALSRFKAALRDIPFSEFSATLDDFKLNNCARNEALIAVLKGLGS